jgi:hypothetical protein
MPRYLALYTPLPGAFQGPPDPQHMAEMEKSMIEQMRLGKLVATGGLKRRDTDAVAVHLDKAGAFAIDEKPQADWMRANGFAILQDDTREKVIEGVKHFLQMVGGGTSELIEISGGPER